MPDPPASPPSVAETFARTERLLASDRLTAPTRAALRARLDRRFGAPRAFDALQMRTLRAAVERLVPCPLAEAADLAGAFDQAVAAGDGDGWRYAELPPDLALHRCGLDALDAAARSRFGAPFDALEGARRDDLLADAGAGRLALAGGIASALWFEELLALLVELHYGHPAVQVAIGYDGMADAAGFTDVGLAEVAAAHVARGG